MHRPAPLQIVERRCRAECIAKRRSAEGRIAERIGKLEARPESDRRFPFPVGHRADLKVQPSIASRQPKQSSLDPDADIGAGLPHGLIGSRECTPCDVLTERLLGHGSTGIDGMHVDIISRKPIAEYVGHRPQLDRVARRDVDIHCAHPIGRSALAQRVRLG